MENQNQTQTPTSTPPQVLSEPIKPQCKYCKAQVLETFYFCPNCGKKLKEPPFRFSLLKSLLIIIASLLLPPYGLFPGIKYLLKDDSKAKAVGIIAIMLTFVSIGIMLIASVSLVKKVSELYGQIYQIQNTMNGFSSTPNQGNNSYNQEELIKQIQTQQDMYDQILIQQK